MRHKESYMFTIIKWVFTVLVAGLLWLVGKYTAEYFNTQPIKK